MLKWLQSIGLVPKSQTTTAASVGLVADRAGIVVTSTGRGFDVLNPDPDQVSMPEIAHALSQINRFNGHTKFPYSVAQHLVLCAEECIWRYPYCFLAALQCLLHDAAEAYVGDVIRPIKGLIADSFRPIEDAVQLAILQSVGSIPTLDEMKIVHEIDNAVVMKEAIVLMRGSENWSWGHTFPASVKINEWAPCVARGRFLDEFNRLMDAADLHPSTVLFQPRRATRDVNNFSGSVSC